jgi:hypothetical protein
VQIFIQTTTYYIWTENTGLTLWFLMICGNRVVVISLTTQFFLPFADLEHEMAAEKQN